ncbi:hypothetical protein LWI29_004088 [Acer saccharum]|uniref:Uncharacterized protein n=1 Tax=Acer saccharum TaxID=4024 RepID=A0AA39VAI9_ACESA|nr:hypothetical protein LWI29_004088 [Acer saccharum]
MQRHVLETDADLLSVLGEYDKRNLDNIEFNIDVIPYAFEPPNTNLVGQTPNSNTETQPNTTRSSSVVLVDFDIVPDFEFHPDSKSNEDSDISLVDSIVEAEDAMDVNGNIDNMKLVSVSWDNVCLPKDEGGLGLHDPVALNNAANLKFCWDSKTGTSI